MKRAKNEIELLIKKKEDNLTRLYEDKLENLISKEQYLIFNKKFSEEIEEYKKQLDFFAKQIDALSSEKNDDSYKKSVLEKYKHIENLTRIIADEFVEAIYVSRENKQNKRNITIKWKI